MIKELGGLSINWTASQLGTAGVAYYCTTCCYRRALQHFNSAVKNQLVYDSGVGGLAFPLQQQKFKISKFQNFSLEGPGWKTFTRHDLPRNYAVA